VTPRLALLVAPLLLAACTGFAKPPSTTIGGGVAVDSSRPRTVTVTLEWPAYELAPGAGPVTYEVRIWRAENALPREEVARVAGIVGTKSALDVLVPHGEYVWSVRAHFVRNGWPCASGWYVVAGVPDDDHLLPRRGFPPLVVR
jgi:hypothetical protein